MNAEKKFPWFKFWAQDWMTNPEVRRLTAAQRGVLFDFLCADWADSGIPTDAKEAKSLCAKGSKLRDVETVLRLFRVEIGEGKVTHPSLYDQRPEAMLRRLRARSGGIARHSSGSAQAEVKHSHAHSGEEDSEEEKKIEEKSPPLRVRVRDDFFIPETEEEAIAAANDTDAPSQFIAEFFHQMKAVGWVDASNRPVRCWNSYVRKSYLKQQRESHRRGTKKAEGVTLTDAEMDAKHANGF